MGKGEEKFTICLLCKKSLLCLIVLFLLYYNCFKYVPFPLVYAWSSSRPFRTETMESIVVADVISVFEQCFPPPPMLEQLVWVENWWMTVESPLPLAVVFAVLDDHSSRAGIVAVGSVDVLTRCPQSVNFPDDVALELDAPLWFAACSSWTVVGVPGFGAAAFCFVNHLLNL